jgi:hypothetical protein
MAAAPPDPAVIGTASDRGLRPLAFPRSKFDASLMPDKEQRYLHADHTQLGAPHQ